MKECGYPKLVAVVFPGVDEAELWLNNPLPSLKQQIQRDIETIDPTIPPVKDLPFVETLAEWTNWLGGEGETGELLIILDHFEEFLERRDKNIGQDFIDEFADAVNCQDLK